MSKRSPSRKKTPTEVWVALIGLIGVVVTALLTSPILANLLQNTPAPTIPPTQITASLPPGTGVPTNAETSMPSVIPPTCTPSASSEVPAGATVIIEPLKGAMSQAPFSSLRYELRSSLTLVSGITIDFARMRGFELSNPGFNTDFAADIQITFLDCTTHTDRIQSRSSSDLTADTEVGHLRLHILDVKRVDFRW